MKKEEIISIAPGRTCLFGDHQDYLGLPVIACAINRHIRITAVENGSMVININKIDINEKRTIYIDKKIDKVDKGDFLLSALKVVRRYGCIPNKGFDISISGNIPINAGISSSSALMISWINFLFEAYGAADNITPEYVSQIAYEAEVLEQDSPGGKMDQFSIGLGEIIYLETDKDLEYEIIKRPIKGIIIGESGIPKETIGVLGELKEKGWLAINSVKKSVKNFEIKTAKKSELNKYLNFVPIHLKSILVAAISNHDITKRALKEFKKEQPDTKKIGILMNEHHDILKNLLKVTVPKIDEMIDEALKAGAYGAKIVGSGRGGSIVVIAPEGKEQEIINGILKAGAKNAYQVEIVPGARIIKTIKVNQ